MVYRCTVQFTDNNEHVNFSPWHTNFVARCNIARLSNDMRKYALHCMTAGRAQEYVTHVHNRRYSYIYKHLIQQYGDGSAHVGYQEQFDTVVQHSDERIEEYGARWRTAFKRRFGKRFKLDTTKNMSDLIRFVANDYVKSQFAALEIAINLMMLCGMVAVSKKKPLHTVSLVNLVPQSILPSRYHQTSRNV